MSENITFEVQTFMATIEADENLEFRWKPAAALGVVNWPLVGTTLTGPDRALDLAHVTSAALVEHLGRGFRFIRLDLFEGRDRRATVSLTIAVPTPTNDPDMVAFWNCIEAIAGVLAERDPHLPVAMGEKGRVGVVIFAIGLLAISLTGLGGARGPGSTLVPSLALVGFGVAIAGANLPWRKRPEVPISTLAVKGRS
ncbi:MAG: hypothetical protein AB8B94_19635 [Hyphomicrobiales bacterium]